MNMLNSLDILEHMQLHGLVHIAEECMQGTAGVRQVLTWVSRRAGTLELPGQEGTVPVRQSSVTSPSSAVPPAAALAFFVVDFASLVRPLLFI